jgi:hypothetical protein
MKVQFILPRIKHILTTNKEIMKKYAQQEQEFSNIRKKVEHNNKMEERKDFENMVYIEEEDQKQYNEYLQNRALDSIILQKAQLIKKFDDKKLNTLNEKLDAYYKIPQRMWDVFGNAVRDLNFGVQRDLEVISPVSKQKVTRRFQFRLLDFIPTMELQDTSGYTVSFGE